MKKLILGICVSLASACAPEFRDIGERCDPQSMCDDALECYRGFCVPAERTTGPDPIIEEGDAGPEQSSESAQDADRPETTSHGSATVARDAGSGSSGAASVDAAASKPAPASSPAVTAPPATSGEPNGRPAVTDAGQAAPAPEKKPTPPANPAPPAVPVVPEAGVSADAGVSVLTDAAVSVPVDAAPLLPVLPKNCTVQDCCDEALRSQRGRDDDDDDDRGKGGKSCGCSDPALVPALVGALTCTLGGVVGGLL